MQKLQFESSWDKALPDQDRQAIIDVFQNTMNVNESNIKLTPLWQAMNYRGDLLATTLVHNCTSEKLTFNETSLQYIENDEIIAIHAFSIPQLVIHPETSMPWAFIFPKESLKKQPNLVNGFLKFT